MTVPDEFLVTSTLIGAIRAQYSLPWNGTHGVGHWARVRENGLKIASLTPGVNLQVVELFAVFHDSRRQNEAVDHGHGHRGGELAKKLRGVLFELPDEAFALLYDACRYHTDGLTEADPTVQACWDADRLDLGRVGITPRQRYLCTRSAKDPALIRWADARACQRTVPQFAVEAWFAAPDGF